ncbi:hypothetical protein B0T10DRAFT_545375 [Thelonectria olida]|uniref:Uncharacterized protein n=1 Tax=Thelonectria olida TaxID=1576542 RepID=A0A9P8WD64_9HYPO|nr:hypothetical protein B0T10DRAFT_545375 [Thelonectria olida]
MSNAGHPPPQVETAVDYAQAQKCFCDYQDAPYRFRDQIRHLKGTIQQVEPDGMVHQPGLSAASFPLKKINLDIDSEPEQVSATSSSPPLPSFSFSLNDGLAALTKLRLPPEPLDLGHDLTKDVQQYLNDISLRGSCNILNEWLPLSPVNVNKDEGIVFSPASSRWQMLVQRELGRESFDVSDGAKRVLCDEEHLVLSRNSKLRQEDLGLHKVRFFHRLESALGLNSRQTRFQLEPVSPPMSPPSEVDETFIPSPRVAFVDLTSEPSSPVAPAVAKLQDAVLTGVVDSEPAAPSITESSSPVHVSMQHLLSPRYQTSSLKVDVPLVDSSPIQEEADHPPHMPKEWLQSTIDEPEIYPLGSLGHFDEAMESIMNSCHYKIVRSIEGERLDARESSLRMQVPGLNFDIPEPEWHTQLSDPTTHFRWMNETSPGAFHLESLGSQVHLGKGLKWAPIPLHKGRVPLNEAIEPPGPSSRQYLTLETPQLYSDDYVSKNLQLSILRISDDEEIEIDTSTTDDTPSPLGKRLLPEARTLNNAKVPKPLDEILKSRFATTSQVSTRKATSEFCGLLPESNDSSATSKLLAGFLELRCPKKAKLSEARSRMAKPNSRSAKRPVSAVNANQESVTVNLNLPKAPAPEFRLPAEKCRFIIAMNLSRGLLSRIEKAWPQLDLVDKDFSQYNEVAWSPGTAQRKEVISPLSFEADISISPSVGIILTTILKVKQKPLPSSNSPTPLRHRVQLVSEKYESLIILASEANLQGEYVGNLSASDMAAFADFKRFTTSLQAGVTVELVKGAEETLSKWVLEVMTRFAAKTAAFAKLVSAHDTTWGLCLRRAGLNIFATQVLEARLADEFGDSGMDRFLSMSIEERVSRYGVLLGGSRVLQGVCRVLNKERA